MTASLHALSLFPAQHFFTKIKLLYLLYCMIVGGYVGLEYSPSQWPSLVLHIILWSTVGLTIGCTGLWIETRLRACSRSTLFGGSMGIIVGMAGTGLFTPALALHPPLISSELPSWIMLPVFLLCPYIAMVIGITTSKSLSHFPIAEIPTGSSPRIAHPSSNSIQKLLDSSAIIDGRILPLCTTGFLEGPFVVPQGILHELQALADSGHLSKRTRGKRGLEILSQLQQLQNVEVQVIEDCEGGIATVDHQLIAIAKKREAKIVTNDWNLAKIASLQGVDSLNVNELTYQLRPLVLPGETIRVFIHKEGQGNGQGIAHLDDGTMVVVDDGAPLVGQAVEVVVTRFMQTNTGRMIFSSPHGDHSPFLFNSNPLTQFAR